ncbi:MAG: winged helix-turn-helix domain-containing protein [Alphaproteobacteria bacterium]|nr:winged helix-turn-helix domain-containing protein [Alphaproteobacteria bacterium]
MAEDVLSFGRFRLAVEGRELLRDGRHVKLGGRALDILCVLGAARGALVTKDELMARVWPGLAVEENNLHVHIAALRKALETDAAGRSWIVTVPNRGYRLLHDGAAPPGMGAPATASTVHDEPSIAVLPFENMSGDAQQGYFVDGVTEEIVTALSRIRWLFVIARNSSFAYKGQSADAKRVGRELGVRYVLAGSVRKAGMRVRITGQLIETETGACLWADRFDGLLDDVFDLQDKVATSVAGVIEPALQQAETARARSRPTEDLTAYDLYLRGYAMAISAGARFREALPLMEQAIARDPHYGPALAWAAVGHVRLVMDGRSEDPQADRGRGAELARRALEAAGDDPGVIANAALALAYVGEDIGAMMALIDRALALNPSHARGWHVSGMLRFYAGELDAAISHVETSLRLSTRARVGWGYTWIGAAHFLSGRFDEGAAKLLMAIQEDPSFPDPYRFLAACYAHMGRLDEAREVVARLDAITPIRLPDASYIRNPEHRETLLSGLRLAADAVLGDGINER